MTSRHAKIRSHLGTRIREMRLKQKMSQEQLAARAGLSYKYLGEVERGTGNPTVETLGSLADALGLDIAQLFGLQSEPASRARLAVDARRWAKVKRAAILLTEAVGRTARRRRRSVARRPTS